MGYEPLSDEQREIRDLIRTLARERIAPRAAEIDETGEFPWDMVELFREHEILGLPFEERFGGTGTGALMVLVAIEEISKACATTGLILALQELGALAIKNDGTEEQKERYLPRLASGEWLPAYALTEPGSGSDAAAMRSEARREGDEYVLNGSKRFITNAGVASLYVVFAKTDPSAGHGGISAFLVESGYAGLRGRAHRAEDGHQGLDDGRALLQRLPGAGRESDRRGGRGLQGRDARPRSLASGHRRAGARHRAGGHRLRARVREGRVTMGKPIAEHQLIAAKLAEMETKCEAARGLLYKVGSAIDEGIEPLAKLSAMTKLFCGDIAMEVTTEAVQVLGGYGYMKEYPVERMMRDAKITQIYEGTQEIQRIVIAREMMKEARSSLLAGVV